VRPAPSALRAHGLSDHATTLRHASWLNQIEIIFSIIQRKVLTPNDFGSLQEVVDRLDAFERHYNQIAKPFDWHFTRADLAQLLARKHPVLARLVGKLGWGTSFEALYRSLAGLRGLPANVTILDAVLWDGLGSALARSFDPALRRGRQLAHDA
jgi:hypothetical protein